MRNCVSGFNLGEKYLDARIIRTQQRSNSALAFYLPSNSRWNASEVLVRTSHRTYTVEDYEHLFRDIDYQTGYEMWEDTRNLIHDLKPPGVEVLCLYGIGVNTVES